MHLEFGGRIGNITMDFKVPGKILREFAHIAQKNYSTNGKDPGHIETMAIMVGSGTTTETVVTKIIFPDQIGAPYQVSSEGNFFNFDFYLLTSLKNS